MQFSEANACSCVYRPWMPCDFELDLEVYHLVRADMYLCGIGHL